MIRSPRARYRRAFILSLYLFAAPVAAGNEVLHAPPEESLVSALENMQRGAFDDALADLNTTIARQPDFRLAHYLREKLLPIGTAEKQPELVDEALLRWSHYLSMPPPEAKPSAVWRLAPRFRHVVVVDLSRHRLYLWRNDGENLTLVADFYASIGRGGIGKETEGDLRTPLGVYHVTEFKSDDELPELYGDGAFPVNYPNDLDRLRGRTGYGIWIHGVPRDTYSREPLTSEGCVVIANSDLQWLRDYLRPGLTPVVLTDELAWLTPRESRARREELTRALEAWRESLESGKTERLLAHYAADFVSETGLDKTAFVERMSKPPVAPGGNEVSIYPYPGEDRKVLIQIEENASRREQLWRRDSAFGWRIVYEGRVGG